MASRKPSRPRGMPPCGDLGPDDGVDPRIFFSDDQPRKRDEHKLGRTCSLVARTLRLVFPEAFGDAAFSGMLVESVAPAPDASRLLVTIEAPGALDEPVRAAALARLAGIRGALRGEVAAMLQRKRAPNLVFEIIDRRTEERP